MKQAAGMLGLALLIGGCASAPLERSNYQLTGLADGEVALPCEQGFPDVRVGRLLNGDGLVLQTSAVNWHQAHEHKWAVPLREQLVQTLLQDQQLRQWLCANDGAVVMQDFFGTLDNQARVAGYWQWLDANGNRQTRVFEQQQVLSADGYAALVHALSKAWQQVLDEQKAQL